MDETNKVVLERLVAEYFRTSDDEDAEAVLSQIIRDHASQLVRAYFRRRFNAISKPLDPGVGDVDDLANLASLGIVKGFRRHRTLRLEGIRNFDGYVRAICNSTHANYWRERFADYYKLKNRVRYLLKKPKGPFTVERSEAGVLRCALIDHSMRDAEFSTVQIVGWIRKNVTDHPVMDEFALVAAALEKAKGWLLLNDLVAILAEIRGINAIPPFETNVDEWHWDRNLIDGDDRDTLHERFFELRSLWVWIRQLEPKQKIALLYHLRDSDGRELNTVWFESGIATLAEIAEQFGLPENEMAALLVRLPLMDREIAEIMAKRDDRSGQTVTPSLKQVRNLRKTARASLQRRMDGKVKRNKPEL